MERIKRLSIVMLVSISVLCLRLAYFTLYKGENLSKQAVLQRTENISVKTVRGVIYDRNMLAITEGQSRLHAAVIPQECTNIDDVSRLIGQKISEEDIQIFPLEAVTEEQAQLVRMRGVSLFNVSERYNSKGLLSHVIGYTSDEGGFGIERVFNDKLKVEYDDSISMIKNANRELMSGLGYNKISKPAYNGVKLTIDYHIQKIAEKAMDNSIKSGAAIVVDVKTGDIVAMVSRPNFKQSEIAKYLTSDEGELINRAIMPYDIGSVFKVVLTIAALEDNHFYPKSQFYCNGSLNVLGREFVCNNKEGHGYITLEEGIAHSCNIVFYTIGQKIGIENINRYARRFGFGERVLGIEEFGEGRGNIPSDIENTPHEIANISIGQGNVSVTPLQVADLFCTIANNGIRRRLMLIKGIVDENGVSADFEPEEIGRVFSVATAESLKKMLEMVVEGGTGTRARIEDWGAAGKTGSAETGWEKDGETMTHGWFAGYFPVNEPRYACVVLAENGKSGAMSAAPVFREIGEGIKSLGR